MRAGGEKEDRGKEEEEENIPVVTEWSKPRHGGPALSCGTGQLGICSTQERRISQIRRTSRIVVFIVTLRRTRIRRLEVEASRRGEEEGRVEVGDGGGTHIDEDSVDAFLSEFVGGAGSTLDIFDGGV